MFNKKSLIPQPEVPSACNSIAIKSVIFNWLFEPSGAETLLTSEISLPQKDKKHTTVRLIEG